MLAAFLYEINYLNLLVNFWKEDNFELNTVFNNFDELYYSQYDLLYYLSLFIKVLIGLKY